MKLVLKSEGRKVGSSSLGRFDLDDIVSGRFKLVGFYMTDNIYNVTTKNNKVYTSAGTYTIPVGYYPTALDMAKTIEDSGDGYTITQHSRTNKLTFVSTSFSFTWGTNKTNSARKLLGFTEQDTASNTTHTSDIAPDICPHKVIFVDIDQVRRKSINSPNYFSTTFALSGSSSFGGVLRVTKNDSFSQYIHFDKNTRHIGYRFHDADGHELDLNGSEWFMILESAPFAAFD